MVPASETTQVWVADVLRRQFPTFFRDLRSATRKAGIGLRQAMGARCPWIRDWGPLQATASEYVQFRYDPRYLKNEQHLVTPPQVARRTLPKGTRITMSPIVMDGGGIVGAGRTAVMTSRIYEENPTYGKRRLKRDIQELLELDKLVVIPAEPGDIFGHADSVVQLADDRTAVVNDYSRIEPAFASDLNAILRRNNIERIVLPYEPTSRKTKGIPWATGCYVNYLHTRHAVFVPLYGIGTDARAMAALKRVFDVPVIPVNAATVAQHGGSVHCVTLNLLPTKR